MAIIYGSASWYQTCNESSSGTPNGACGTCYRDRPGLAYPNLLNHGTDWAGYCGYSIPRLACGTVLTITNNDCNTNSRAIPIVDKGPNLISLDCREDWLHCQTTTRAFRLIDLTRQSFLDLGGQLTWGTMGVQIVTP